MSHQSTSHSATIRTRLKHPVIDSDGHMIEFEPGFLDYLKQVGGQTMLDRYVSPERNTGSWGKLFDWYRLSPGERQDQHATRSPWWALPTKNTLDRATASLPKLLHERLDEIGIDFTVLYPSLGLAFPHIEDAELRQASCRALNMFNADYFRAYADRMTPAACIPMHTPRSDRRGGVLCQHMRPQGDYDGWSCPAPDSRRHTQRCRRGIARLLDRQFLY